MEIAFIYALAAICTRITPLELEVAEHVMALTPRQVLWDDLIAGRP